MPLELKIIRQMLAFDTNIFFYSYTKGKVFCGLDYVDILVEVFFFVRLCWLG